MHPYNEIMKIANNVEMLEIESMGSKVNLTLTWDKNSLVLIDTGFPGQTELIVKAISSAGFQAKNITHIILTHQDIDHIGCLKELLKLAPGAQVMAHKDEAPYINGRKTPVKLAGMLEQYDKLPPDRKTWCDNMKRAFPGLVVPVTHTISDGEVLPECGGIEVIFTPGHTPGHICLYLRESKILVTGDALNVAEGKLAGPNPQFSFDMDLALKSAEKAKKFPFMAVVSHHGGYLKTAFR